jgi:hypothetical protein
VCVSCFLTIFYSPTKYAANVQLFQILYRLTKIVT